MPFVPLLGILPVANRAVQGAIPFFRQDVVGTVRCSHATLSRDLMLAFDPTVSCRQAVKPRRRP
jgi:hypothetical protein